MQQPPQQTQSDERRNIEREPLPYLQRAINRHSIQIILRSLNAEHDPEKDFLHRPSWIIWPGLRGVQNLRRGLGWADALNRITLAGIHIHETHFFFASWRSFNLIFP